MPGILRASFAIVQMIVFAGLGILAMVGEAAWLNGVLRAAMVLFGFTNALFPFDHSYGPVARMFRLSMSRSMQLRWTGIAAASTLTVPGALMTWSAVGYLAAACAFFFASISWWIVQMIGQALKRETPGPART